MIYLLDTHVVLRWMADDPELSQAARRLMRDPSNVLWVSAVSAWEIAIKRSSGKLRAPENFEETLRTLSMQTLAMTLRHALWVEKLPLYHRDPFDRLLIAQAQAEGLTFLTHDRFLQKYGPFVQVI